MLLMVTSIAWCVLVDIFVVCSAADLSDLMSKLSAQSQLQHTQTVYSYSQDDQQQLMRAQTNSTAGEQSEWLAVRHEAPGEGGTEF